jgi:hypothetical protein
VVEANTAFRFWRSIDGQFDREARGKVLPACPPYLADIGSFILAVSAGESRRPVLKRLFAQIVGQGSKP